MQVEVFKTNVVDPEKARWLVEYIERSIGNCQANFDLSDCDRVLRIVFDGENPTGRLIEVLNKKGFHAEVLADTIETIENY